MKLKQRNLSLFLGVSAGAMYRQSLRPGIALNVGEAITSPALMPHTLRFLCRSQKSLLFVLAGQSSFQVVTLMPLKIANLTLTQQIEYRTHEAVADLVPLERFTYIVAKTKDYKTGENQKYLTINFDHIAPCLGFQLISK